MSPGPGAVEELVREAATKSRCVCFDPAGATLERENHSGMDVHAEPLESGLQNPGENTLKICNQCLKNLGKVWSDRADCFVAVLISLH